MKSFVYTKSGFTQSNSGELGDIEGFNRLTSEKYKSEKRNKFAGIEKVFLKCDCIHGIIVNGIREPI